MNQRSHAPRTSGLTLVEIVVTIGLIATVMLSLVLMFGKSVGTAEEARAESVSTFIAEHIRARLLTEPDWPAGIATKSFSKDVNNYGVPTDTFVYDRLYFDENGIEIDPSSNVPIYQVILTFSRSPAYQSRRLDFVRIEVKPLTSVNSEPITFSFQRAVETPRKSS